MSLRLALSAALVVFAGCATGKAATAAAPAGTARVDVGNQAAFDIAACGLRPLALSSATEFSIKGALLVAQPSLMECLVPPDARGPEAQTHARVQLTVSDVGVVAEVGGANLLPPGKACLEAVVKKLGFPPVPAGAPPAVSALEVVHVSGVSPTVKLGVNEPSDVVGAVRLAQREFCGCYEPLQHQPPPQLKAALSLFPDKPLAVVMDAAGDKPSQAVSACVQEKLSALTLPKVTAPLEVSYPFILVDSFAEKASASAAPGVQFTQLDAIRNQRNADAAIAFGARFVSAANYDAVVAKYKSKPTPALLPELKTKCQAVLDADDVWLAGLKRLLDATQALVAHAQDLSLKDLTWAEAANAAQAQLVKLQADQASADKQRQNDVLACPRMN